VAGGTTTGGKPAGRRRPPGKDGDNEKLVVKNRRATFDYLIEETCEGGLVLVGSEVKSMRAGTVDIVDAFATVERGEMWLKQLYIAPFEQASCFPHEPRRNRKVLLHAREIAQMGKEVARGGYTLVPLRIYFKRGRVKVLLGLGKGKKTHDKRAEMAAKDANREARAAMGRKVKGGDR
jgi:SsrA-binding protein